MVDYGNGNTMGAEPSTEANECLVAMLVGLRESWKLVIGYFLIHGLKSGVLAGIIRESLTSTYDVGVKVFNVTMDGTSHNVMAFQALGAKIYVKKKARNEDLLSTPI